MNRLVAFVGLRSDSHDFLCLINPESVGWIAQSESDPEYCHVSSTDRQRLVQIKMRAEDVADALLHAVVGTITWTKDALARFPSPGVVYACGGKGGSSASEE